MRQDLSGCIAVVTGPGGPIGRAVIDRLVADNICGFALTARFPVFATSVGIGS